MQKTIAIFILLLLSSVVLTNCAGYSVRTQSRAKPGFFGLKQELPKVGWNKLPIFKKGELSASYDEIAGISVTGNKSSTEKRLLQLMRREGGKYGADAIIYLNKKTVTRSTVNGVAATVNLISIFDSTDDCDCCDDEPLETGSDYATLELIGVAIKYTKEKN
ncbi:MAG: hypothetical protein DHS20C18_25310 [Saprospiraceae bacterium]|nr:MAG: hypothetical protein DHS20C18_25310 [Saprospiraceae bacterium]